MQLDAFDLVQGLGGQVAFAAMGTTDDGHVLDDEEARPLAVAARYSTHVHAALTTHIAYHASRYSRPSGKVEIITTVEAAHACAATRSIPARPPIPWRRWQQWHAGQPPRCARHCR